MGFRLSSLKKKKSKQQQIKPTLPILPPYLQIFLIRYADLKYKTENYESWATEATEKKNPYCTFHWDYNCKF